MTATTTAAQTTATPAPVARTLIPAHGPGAAGGWRRLLTAVPAHASSTRDLEGDWLDAGATVQLPVGALVVAVDHHHGPDRWEITALRAHAEGLHEVARWTRRSPLGRRETIRLRALLDPAAAHHTARTLTTPNRDSGTCRRCGHDLPSGTGLVHHTPSGTVLVCRTCPARPARLPVNIRPGRCAVCSGWVAAKDGIAVLIGNSTGDGRYQPVHRVCPEHPLPGPPLTADAWCLDCHTPVPAGTGYWLRGPHHAPGTCTPPPDGLPRWIITIPHNDTPWTTGTVRRIHHTPRPGEPHLPEGLPGGRIIADTGHMTVLAHVLDLRTTQRGRTLALVRAATWTEAAPLLAAELDTALKAQPDGGTFLARAVIERLHGDRGWVAEITGHDPRHGLARHFLRPQTDYDNADAHGHTGVLDAWTLRPRRVYEVSRPIGPPAKNWRDIRRTNPRARVTEEHRAFVRVTADGDIVEITREEAQAWPSAALEWMS
ncbi:hypothetical protein ACFY1P_33940 [Streptomyces sp. NPDC001407]|uniref:hypothetical protein n=1 Tax=Streptomyces sp. NPDC001407 TaxID=3364573 RepID=UPI003691C5C9